MDFGRFTKGVRTLPKPRDLGVDRFRTGAAEALLGGDRGARLERSKRLGIELGMDGAGANGADAGEGDVLVDREGHKLSDGLVGFAKGDTAAHEGLGQVGGLREAAFEGLESTIGVEGQVRQREGHDLYASEGERPRVEERNPVVLLVPVVAAREPFHQREQGDDIADGASALAPNELEHVGILLLRHHARTRRDRSSQPNEAELTRREVHDVAGDATESENDARGGPRPIESEVAVPYGVQGVARRLPRGE